MVCGSQTNVKLPHALRHKESANEAITGWPISIMPALGVVPYLDLYKGLALHVISLRLYTADAILAHSHLVEPRQLGHVLINCPVQHYLDSRPNAARRMLSQHGFTFAPGENFHDQLLTHWHQLSLRIRCVPKTW